LGGEFFGADDVLTQALGNAEQRGRVRGMGKFVTPNRYFLLPTTFKSIIESEKKKTDKRFNKLEEELEKVKKGINSASEAGSCPWETFDDEPEIEPVVHVSMTTL
jgi:hypothetical protein